MSRLAPERRALNSSGRTRRGCRCWESACWVQYRQGPLVRAGLSFDGHAACGRAAISRPAGCLYCRRRWVAAENLEAATWDLGTRYSLACCGRAAEDMRAGSNGSRKWRLRSASWNVTKIWTSDDALICTVGANTIMLALENAERVSLRVTPSTEDRVCGTRRWVVSTLLRFG
ncbi:hypothetical protein GY45DRAFT_124070 [Cubamyces sp. BRFM 1775]|nr:hypothetical protein GY45DRAFT_124070 [Cubamyces sp. BRFM 1775]